MPHTVLDMAKLCTTEFLPWRSRGGEQSKPGEKCAGGGGRTRDVTCWGLGKPSWPTWLLGRMSRSWGCGHRGYWGCHGCRSVHWRECGPFENFQYYNPALKVTWGYSPSLGRKGWESTEARRRRACLHVCVINKQWWACEKFEEGSNWISIFKLSP